MTPPVTRERVVADMRRVARFGWYDGMAHRDPRMARYMDRCRRVLREFGCTVLYTHGEPVESAHA